MTEKGNFIAHDVAIPLIDLESLYLDEKDFDIEIYNDSVSYMCPLVIKKIG